MTWKVGDWVIFDCNVGQIKALREDGYSSFTDGFFETSGKLTDRFRPLTLRNKLKILFAKHMNTNQRFKALHSSVQNRKSK